MQSRDSLLILVMMVVAALGLSTCAEAVVPQTMNYQVMLTDDADQPLSNQAVTLEFGIFDDPDVGALLWSEVHGIETNAIGVVSVVLGSINPLAIAFDQPLWLQVDVNGEAMLPRRELTAASSALSAHDSELLGGVPATSYALDSDLYLPGTLNDPTNPLEWTKLKNMPTGFADGVDDAGVGDGHSLDASDGLPVDVVRVDSYGNAFVGPPIPPGSGYDTASLKVYASGGLKAAVFDCDSGVGDQCAVFARSNSSSAVIACANTPFNSIAWPLQPTGILGVGFSGSSNGGQFTALGSGVGCFCTSVGEGHALHSVADGSGYSGYFEGGSGVYMTRDTSYPVLTVDSPRTSGNYGDAGYFASASGASSYTWTLYSACYQGTAGRFAKHSDDNQYVVTIQAVGSSAEGLYVDGNIYTTGSMARGVDTSRGTEPVFVVASPEARFTDSGRGQLSSGVARVEFDRTFAEVAPGRSDLVITVTPLGRWSALYIEGTDREGFVVKSEAGDLDVEFSWTAVGRSGIRGEVTIPDRDELRKVAREKEALTEGRRPERREAPGLIVK